METDALPAEREFVMVASEFYPTAKPIDGVYVGDLDRMTAADPEYVVFDGSRTATWMPRCRCGRTSPSASGW